LAPGTTGRVIQKRSGQMLGGLLKTSREVALQELAIIPEFSHSCCIDEQHAFVFAGPCDYDIIFGRNFLRKIGMKVDFDLGTTAAFDITIKMKHKSFYTNPFSALSNILDDIEDDHDTVSTAYKVWNQNMKRLTSTKLSPSKLILMQNNIPICKTSFQNVPSSTLVNLDTTQQKRCIWSSCQELNQNMQNLILFLTISLKFFKQSLNLIEIGVLSRVRGTKWVSPTFIIAKKDLQV
jgi:hypothetical protein